MHSPNTCMYSKVRFKSIFCLFFYSEHLNLLHTDSFFQYEEAVDAELAWVGETERKLASLGPLSLEPDVTVAQLQVQRAFNIDIIRHKDTVDQLLATRDDILETCNDTQKDALMVS